MVHFCDEIRREVSCEGGGHDVAEAVNGEGDVVWGGGGEVLGGVRLGRCMRRRSLGGEGGGTFLSRFVASIRTSVSRVKLCIAAK